jgi:hypothetical protein
VGSSPPSTAVRDGRSGRIGPHFAGAAVAGLLLTHGILAWLGRPAGIETGHDDARYLLLARALRSFSYVDLWHVGHPVEILYPPGFPALLVTWGAVAGVSFDLQVVLGVSLSMTALALAYLIAARHLDRRVALAGLAVLAVNPMLVTQAGTVASEMAYEVWSLLALLLVLQPPSRARTTAVVVLAILAAMTRSVGVTLVGAIVLHLVLRRNWRAAVAAAAAAVIVIGPWLAWTVLAPNQHVGFSYAADVASGGRVRASGMLGMLIARVSQNTVGYARSLVGGVLSFPNLSGTRLDAAAWVAFAIAGLFAGVVAAWRRWLPVMPYLASYVALLLLWPWNQSRFLEPITLLLTPLWLWGLWSMAARRSGGWLFVTVVLPAALVGISGLVDSLGSVERRLHCGRIPAPPGPNACLSPDQLAFMAGVRWIRDNASSTATILSAKEGTLYYFTGRPTVPPAEALAQDSATFSAWLGNRGVEYVLLTGLTPSERRLGSRARAACRSLEVAARFADNGYLFRVVRRPTAGAVNACVSVDAYERATAAPPGGN